MLLATVERAYLASYNTKSLITPLCRPIRRCRSKQKTPPLHTIARRSSNMITTMTVKCAAIRICRAWFNESKVYHWATRGLRRRQVHGFRSAQSDLASTRWPGLVARLDAAAPVRAHHPHQIQEFAVVAGGKAWIHQEADGDAPRRQGFPDNTQGFFNTRFPPGPSPLAPGRDGAPWSCPSPGRRRQSGLGVRRGPSGLRG